MKIRADFVTNSSSSSYTTVMVTNQVLCELLRDYKKKLKLSTVSKSEIVLVKSEEMDLGSNTHFPSNRGEAVAEIWKILQTLSRRQPELQAKLEDAKQDIDDCYQEILIVNGYYEWGGDSDLRYDWNYPTGTTQEEISRGATEEGVYFYYADVSAAQGEETLGLRHFATDGWSFRSHDFVSARYHLHREKLPVNKFPIKKPNIKKTVEKYKAPKAEAVVSNDANPAIMGKKFVVTGDVHIFKDREALKAYIEKNGGKLSGSVSSRTDYLINNDVTSTSTKNMAAKQNNVPIISEKEFIEKFNVQIG